MTYSTKRRFITVVACLAAVGACARARLADLEPGERRAFRASSSHTGFFIVGEFDGVAEVWKDSILVLVTRGRIDTRRQSADSVVLRVALANGDTAARWRVGDASGAARLTGIRRDASGTLLDTLRFTLKRPDRPLYDHWLVFVFELDRGERAADGRPLLHTAFAHSQPNVFAARSDASDSQP